MIEFPLMALLVFAPVLSFSLLFLVVPMLSILWGFEESLNPSLFKDCCLALFWFILETILSPKSQSESFGTFLLSSDMWRGKIENM